MIREEVGRIIIGQVYRMYLIRAFNRGGYWVTEATRYGTYRTEGYCFHFPSMQECVLYKGLDGPDKDRYFTCTIMDFALKFRPEPQVRECEGGNLGNLPEGKTIDTTVRGEGV